MNETNFEDLYTSVMMLGKRYTVHERIRTRVTGNDIGTSLFLTMLHLKVCEPQVFVNCFSEIRLSMYFRRKFVQYGKLRKFRFHKHFLDNKICYRRLLL